jgi:CRP-like cAMP-binding protein/flavin-dependent dehydrogenase
MAERIDLSLQVEIYEPRDFSRPGPAGCNMCGGIVSESLVQELAAEGINLPDTVVRRGIDSYVLHTDEGRVRIETPLQEKRIAAVYRGVGPRGSRNTEWRSFDGHLLEMAVAKGAKRIAKRVDGVGRENGRPWIRAAGGECQSCDLLVVAAGLNSGVLKLFECHEPVYRAPHTTKTHVCEFDLGEEAVLRYFGNAVHIFLLDIPRIEFAAMIPKGDYLTVCLLGHDIDRDLLASFMRTPAVRGCFPPGWEIPDQHCRCSPRMYVRPAGPSFADRMVFVGDCGVTRLYKDGIGAAYRTAKAAARTAVFSGVSSDDFRRHYWPTCRAISRDNRIGEGMFAFTRMMQRRRCARRGVLGMVLAEQRRAGPVRRMSTVLWDMFTGSAPYGEVFLRTLHPLFLLRLFGNTGAGISTLCRRPVFLETSVGDGMLGKTYRDGEAIVRESEEGNCMFVIQTGEVEVVTRREGKEVRLAVLGEGDFFGEMALVTREVRSATVRARGPVRVLTVDRKRFLSRISQDPSLAMRVVEKMSHRIREMNEELSRVRNERKQPDTDAKRG